MLSLRYICFTYLANYSAVSKPHPTEGSEIYTGCGNPRCDKVCCAVCTPLCAGRCARRLCCWLFCLVVLTFLSQRPRVFVILEKTNKTRTSTSYARSLPRKNPGRERFAVRVLYRVAVFIAFGSRCPCSARCNARSYASFGYQRSKHNNNNNNNNNAPPAFFGSRPRLSNRSVI